MVFTEYKTTLDYLVRRLTSRFGEEQVLTLFGGMDDVERGDVKRWFNDPLHPVRVLVATDAAAEGLNLQRTARYLLHFDCPWNPSRIEQRNGRIDRHGQPRDVTIFHFVTDQDQDLAFLAHVIRKADEIREDLGSANEIFDEAAHRRLIAGESASDVQAALDLRLAQATGRVRIEADDTRHGRLKGRPPRCSSRPWPPRLTSIPRPCATRWSRRWPYGAARPQLDCSELPQTCKLLNPSLPGWSEVIDESLRRPQQGGTLGPVSRLAFDAAPSSMNRRPLGVLAQARCADGPPVAPDAAARHLHPLPPPLPWHWRGSLPLDRPAGELPAGTDAWSCSASRSWPSTICARPSTTGFAPWCCP